MKVSLYNSFGKDYLNLKLSQVHLNFDTSLVEFGISHKLIQTDYLIGNHGNVLHGGPAKGCSLNDSFLIIKIIRSRVPQNEM